MVQRIRIEAAKIEYFIDYGTPNMAFLFYFQPFIMEGYFITQNERRTIGA